MFIYVCVKGDIEHNILSFACVGGCFLISLLLVKFKSPKSLITTGLLLNVVADFFLLFRLDIGKLEEHRIVIGLSLFCAVQFCFLLYTLVLNRSIATRVINLAIRVGLCLIAYFILPTYYVLGTYEMIAIMYYINMFATALVLLTHIKKEYVLFVGMVVLLISHLVVGFMNGGILILGMTGPFVEFLVKYNLAFYTYIPALLLIALSPVLLKKKS